MPRLQIADDGLPVQAAPSASIRKAPDDARQPFGRNYGLRPVARPF